MIPPTKKPVTMAEVVYDNQMWMKTCSIYAVEGFEHTGSPFWQPPGGGRYISWDSDIDRVGNLHLSNFQSSL